MCSHTLKVLSLKNITKIHSRYILQRWTKHAKVGIEVAREFENTTNEDPKANMGRRYKELCRLQTQIATKASEDEETYRFALSRLSKILEDLDSCLRKRVGEKPNSSNSNVQMMSTNNVNASSSIKGIKAKEKVRGRSIRPQGALEKAKKKNKVVRQNFSSKEVILKVHLVQN